MATAGTDIGEILLTPRGEERLGDLARASHSQGLPVSEMQLRVLVDHLVETGDCWAVGVSGSRRVRTLARAGGVELDGAPRGSAGIRRISADDLARSRVAANGARGAVIAALAKAVGAGREWEGLVRFLETAGESEGVLALPWPEGGLAVPDSIEARREE